MHTPYQCRQLFAYARESGRRRWLLKPAVSSGGAGIQVVNTRRAWRNVVDKFGSCKKLRREGNLVAQEYVDKPLLVNRHRKFDLRMYMLVASAKPVARQKTFYS